MRVFRPSRGAVSRCSFTFTDRTRGAYSRLYFLCKENKLINRSVSEMILYASTSGRRGQLPLAQKGQQRIV